MKPVRILIVSHTNADANTGTFGALSVLADKLKSLGAVVDFYTYDNVPIWVSSRFKILLFPFFVFMYVLLHWRSWDVIDSSTGDTWVLGLIPRVFKRPALVITSHGLEHRFQDQRNKIWKRVEKARKIHQVRIFLQLLWIRLSLMQADYIFVLTEKEKQYMVEKLFLNPLRIGQMFHPLPEELFTLTPSYNESEFNVLLISQWLYPKGVTYFIQALDNLDKMGVPFTCTIVGGEKDSALAEFLIPDNVLNKITWIPFVVHKEISRIYAGAHVVVSASFFEGFGRVVTEAMAAGLIVVATPVGIAEELIKNHDNGIIIPLKDSDALTQALQWIYAHRKEAYEIGLRGREKIKSIDVSAMIKKRFALYENLSRKISGSQY